MMSKLKSQLSILVPGAFLVWALFESFREFPHVQTLVLLLVMAGFYSLGLVSELSKKVRLLEDELEKLKQPQVLSGSLAV